ncbi:hypothetical protein DB811_13920 [Xanthomonas perforans]|nr:hypothetical protein DB857_22295 [Xanthomonas perforans]TQU86494.1 hypothetical protein DB811_13920 [Xanthomonas perforans]TQV30657.1 hypothetical protein DB856_22650 [Xanthomonas perforans]
MLIAFLGACSGGRPSQSEREFAFLQFVKENSNDEARIEDFKSNQCQNDLPPSSVPVITDKARG